jgi:NAD(P)-dependent dehydrogenase (short-subunit alcohol dehydrogenase family)
MSTLLANKTAIVTGAAGGIGAAIVETFLENGARVLASDVIETSVIQHEYSRFVRADVSDETDVQNLIRRAVEYFGALDILVNNAAVLAPTTSVEKTSLVEFEKLIAVNLRGAFLTCKYSYPLLRESRGCVLNVSSMAGIHGEKDHAIYAATKGAINAFTQSLAVDWGADGIRANAICPSSVLTPNVDAMIEKLPNAGEIIELRKSINALGFTATPRHVSEVAAFLCSSKAAFMTGAIVPVSGGSECGYGLKY